MIGAEQIVGVDLNNDKKAWGEKFGMTDFVNPTEIAGDLTEHIIQITDGGADYSFECVGKPSLMRTALECAHKGWGESCVIGVGPPGQVRFGNDQKKIFIDRNLLGENPQTTNHHFCT